MHYSTLLGAAAVLLPSLVSATTWTGPQAATVWGPSNRVHVYGLDPNGNVMEWIQDNDGIGYTGPQPIGAMAMVNTDLTAIYTTNSGSTTAPTLRVLYYDLNNRIHEYLYTDASGWYDAGILP